ncbi:MAG: glycosyltransferase [Acidimicrobiia bacterium]
MKILVTAQGAQGHFDALAALAARLEVRGHEILFATAPAFCATVEAAGFSARPAGIDWSSNLEETFPEFRHVAPDRRRDWVNEQLWGHHLPRRMLPDIVTMIEDWRPDVVLSGRAELAGPTAAELLGLPYATASAGGSNNLGTFLTQVCPAREHWRAELGLAPDPDGSVLYRYLYLNLIPPAFRPDPGPERVTRHHFRPVEFDASGAAGVPPWVASLRPSLVYLTLGSVLGRTFAHLFDPLVSGARRLGLDVVVTTGRDNPVEAWHAPAERVFAAGYIAQEHLLSKAALVISHGGVNTVLGALSRGVPLVTLPLRSDQFWNARRCEELGVGRTLDAADLTADRVQEVARAVVADQGHQQAASRLAGAIGELPPVDRGVDLLVDVARHRRPQLGGT